MSEGAAFRCGAFFIFMTPMRSHCVDSIFSDARLPRFVILQAASTSEVVNYLDSVLDIEQICERICFMLWRQFFQLFKMALKLEMRQLVL